MTPTDRDQCCCKVADPRDCFVARHPEAQARFDSSLLNRPWNCELCECECHHGEADDEFDDLCATTLMEITNGTANRIQPAQAEPVEAKEPWKPKMGDTVLLPVKAVTDVLVDGGIVVRFGSDTRWVQSSQLRPLPVVQGEGVGK